jgi:hypothetical protein
MLKIKVKYFVFMILSYLFAYLQGGNLPYTIFYGFFVAFIVGLGGLIMHRKLVEVEVRFEKQVYSTGDTDRFTMIVSNESLIPAPYVTVKNKALVSIDSKYNGESISLRLDEGKWLKHEVYFSIRGVYNFGEVVINLKDIFSIFDITRSINRKTLIRVYPKVYDLEETIIKGSDIFKNAVSTKSSIEDMYSTKDIRKYRDGDNLKRINWKVSAKYNELFVRNFDTVSGQELNLFLDMHEKNYEFDRTGLLEEKMIDFSVSLVKHMLNKEIKTKIFINASQPEHFELEEKVDFDKLMDYFLTQKSDSKHNFINFIDSNIYHVSSLGGVGIITTRVSEDLTINLMALRDRGFNILLFYCSTSNDDIKNTVLLDKVGIRCYNIITMHNDDSIPRIG